MNLSELQSYVWAQTDTTSVDLSPQTIAAYIDEAFIRTIAAENDWPFYEHGWQLPQAVGATYLDVPIDVGDIMSVFPVLGGARLQQVNQEEAEDRFTTVPSAGLTPAYYSLWANRLYLWPSHTNGEIVEYIVRGYRTPLTTFDALTGQVDADPRLHRALGHYAIALAYAQQEDDVLEGRYMQRWQDDVSMVRKALMDPATHRPLVMYGNFPRRRGVPQSSVARSGGGPVISG